ncbi:hypothetical protein [Kitasatospora sp. MBT63]|uniref:hypothetical protein n=1 Tax=Kitasatospora sp. MBT63 TaxID=1444768 RepID=UPI00053B5D46|nr:hypothetical protein [Kitasatospora sp. MBT63]
MTYLPTLGINSDGALTLDHTGQLAPLLLDLAEQLNEDEAVGEALGEIADLRDRARAERELDGLGHAEHALDDKATRLIESLGHGAGPLDSRNGVYAIQQARQIAIEARRIAETATAYADRLAASIRQAA